MSWLTPWIIFLVCPVLALIGLWACAPHVPGLRQLRERFDAWAQSCVDAIRNDPPPIYVLTRNVIEELMDEYGPQLATSTNRNILLLGLTSFLGTILPDEVATQGAAYVIVGATVWYALRGMAGRKRADGPIITPRDFGYRTRREMDGGMTAPGREWFESQAVEPLPEEFPRPQEYVPAPMTTAVVAAPRPRRARVARPAKKAVKKKAAKKPAKRRA